jgi:putative tricarboxylic transport membrane protein
VRAVVALRARAPRPAAGRRAGRRRATSLRLALLLGVSVAYVVALRPLGFLAASTLFLALSLLILGERRILILLLVPAGLTGGVLFIFTSLLGLRLPAGTLF